MRVKIAHAARASHKSALVSDHQNPSIAENDYPRTLQRRASEMESSKLEGEALVAAHKDAARKLLILSIAFPIAVVVIIVGHLWAITNQVENLDTAKVATLTAERIGAIWPDVESHMSDVAKQVEPALGKALETEVAAMAPLLEKRLQTDVDATLDTAEKDFSGAVEAALGQMESNQRSVLLAEVPALEADPVAQQHVLASTRGVIASWSQERFHTALEDHVEAMGSIRETLRKGYATTDDVAAEPQDALLAWLELLNEHVGGDAIVASLDGTSGDEKSAKARGKN
jgi:hypothetical protein